MNSLTMADLQKVTYLDTAHIEGRTVKLMPLWDGSEWHVWVPTLVGLLERKILDVTEGDYVGKGAAKQSDLFIPFVHLMWQRASWKDICPLIVAISDDFHNLGTSVAKLRHFFDSRSTIPSGGASRFALTELEYIVTLSRTIFDLLQEMISIIWRDKVRLDDPSAEAFRRGHALPETFSRMVFNAKSSLKTVDEIEVQYGLPRPLAEQYASRGPFFGRLCQIRDDVIHGGTGFCHIFDTERGFCVDPKTSPFSSLADWQPEHYYNENIVSVLPWIADTILLTIDACSRLASTFISTIRIPPDIAPGYLVFVRGPHNQALVDLLKINSGASPWWA